MNNDIRWKQRFENFEKAYLLLHEITTSYEIAKLSDLEKAGVVQRFEILIELSKNLLKDYLEYEGIVNIDVPKAVIRQAFSAKIIKEKDVEILMQALLKRNLTSHTYDKQHLDTTINFIINDFYQVVTELHQYFKDKL